MIDEIAAPQLALPAGIHEGQIKKYFQLGDMKFALVLRNSMNVLLSLPEDFSANFSGVLIAKQSDTQWKKWLEIKDTNETDKNNPYYLFLDKETLYMTVVDQRGGGSGEGVMYLMALASEDSWKLQGCYYFGHNYGDPETDGDYFAHSIDLEKQLSEPLETCSNLVLVPNSK